MSSAEVAFIGVGLFLDGKYGCLVVRNRKSKAWMMPGGHKDRSDKSFEAAALRELREESGVVLNKKRYSVTHRSKIFFTATTDIVMTPKIFDMRTTRGETDAYGIAVYEGSKIVVIDSHGNKHSNFRGGTIRQLKVFFSPLASFNDRTLV